MYHYFYKITNNLNGHFYYGVHSTSNLDDGYMGSGSRLHIAYKKYGIENFTKEILKFFDSRNEAFNYESDFVNEELILNNDCYNIKEGGKGWSNKGLFTAKDKFGNCFMISKDDPRYLNGELVGLQQGFIPVKSSSGKIFMISKDDPRYLNGELKSMMFGTVKVRDKNGNIFSVSKNDPRYLNGELVFFRKGRDCLNNIGKERIHILPERICI